MKVGELDTNMMLIMPDEGTVTEYKEMETLSIRNLKDILKGGIEGNKDPKIVLASLSHKILQQVNNLRREMKGQLSFRVKIFKDISEDKAELKAYIKATYPRIIK